MLDALAAPTIPACYSPMFRDFDPGRGTKRKREKDRLDPRKSRVACYFYAAANDLALLINTLDLQATPNTPDMTALRSSPLSADKVAGTLEYDGSPQKEGIHRQSFEEDFAIWHEFHQLSSPLCPFSCQVERLKTTYECYHRPTNSTLANETFSFERGSFLSRQQHYLYSFVPDARGLQHQLLNLSQSSFSDRFVLRK
jgi:hypothetical protein